MPGTLSTVGDLFDGYGASARGLTVAAFDEMVGRDGAARVPYAAVASSLAQMGPEDVSARASRLARAFMDQGVTFDLDGEERPFPLDVVPRIFTGAEWSKVAAGVAQRVRALELFLADAYGAARIVSDGLIPHEVITSSPGFVRAAYGYSPPNGVRIHVAGIDVVRDEDGEFRVLEDNVRSPSGVSYVLANRAAMARVLPELFWGQPIQMVTDYPARLISALRRAAPASVQDPTVVVLTPGVHNSAFYEHALLARLMGVHLVEGRDLVCHGTDVFLRTTEGEVPVHVIYRRIDDEYLDPLQFRPESLVGCPGVVNAARAGRVTIANGVGNGVADDKLIYTYVPAMIRYYLGEDPILHNVETMHLVDDGVRKDALSRRGDLVFKRVDGSGGKGLVIGPAATGAELDQLALDVECDPRHWIAQRLVALSTSPTWVDNTMVRRHVDLRPFAVNDGEDVWVLPGGLTRVALGEGGLVVNSSQGGGSKDTWVVGGGLSMPLLPPRQVAPFQAGPPMDVGPASDGELGVQQQQATATATGPGMPVTRALLSRVAESIFWVGPVRGAGRGNGAHPRRLGVPGPRAERRRGLARGPPPPRRHGAPRFGHRDALAGDGAPGDRSREQVVHRRCAGGGPGEHTGGAARRARGVLGAHQRHLGRAAVAVGGRPPGRAGVLPLLREDPVRRHDGPGRHHDEPRPDLALLHLGPLPGAHRRGRPSAGHGGVRRGVRQRPRHAVALLRRL